MKITLKYPDGEWWLEINTQEHFFIDVFHGDFTSKSLKLKAGTSTLVQLTEDDYDKIIELIYSYKKMTGYWEWLKWRKAEERKVLLPELQKLIEELYHSRNVFNITGWKNFPEPVLISKEE